MVKGVNIYRSFIQRVPGFFKKENRPQVRLGELLLVGDRRTPAEVIILDWRRQEVTRFHMPVADLKAVRMMLDEFIEEVYTNDLCELERQIKQLKKGTGTNGR